MLLGTSDAIWGVLRAFLSDFRMQSQWDLHVLPGVNKKPQKFIFEYWVFSQKSYLNVGCFEEIHICIPKIKYLHTS